MYMMDADTGLSYPITSRSKYEVLDSEVSSADSDEVITIIQK